METDDVFPIDCILTKDTEEDEKHTVFKTFCLDKIKKEIDEDMDRKEIEEIINDVVLTNRNVILAQERTISVSSLNLIKKNPKLIIFFLQPRSAGDRKYGREQNKKYKATKERIRKDKKKRLISPPPPDLHPKKIIKLTEGLPQVDNDNSQSSCDENLDNLSTSIELAIKAEDDETDKKNDGKPFKKHSAVYEEWKKQQIKLKAKKRKGGEM